MTSQFDFPLVSVGCSQLTKHIISIEDNAGFTPMRKVIFDSHPVDVRNPSIAEILRTDPCYFWADSLKCIPVISNALRIVLESCDNPQKIGFLYGIGNALGSSGLEDIRDSYPSISITSIGILPIGRISGIENLNAALNSLYSLSFSDGISIRCVDEMENLLRTNVPEAKLSFKSINACLATDLCLSFQHSDWASSHCGYENRFFDVRSSLWRGHVQKQFAQIKTKLKSINSLRSLAQNMRAWKEGAEDYTGSDVSLKSEGQDRVFGASLMTLHTDSSRSDRPLDGMPKLSHARIPSRQVTNAFNWATPDILWPSSVVDHSSVRCISESKAESCLDEIWKAQTLVLGFECPKVLNRVRNFLSHAEKLVKNGAFLQR